LLVTLLVTHFELCVLTMSRTFCLHYSADLGCKRAA
jgi:hypothetical protein